MKFTVILLTGLMFFACSTHRADKKESAIQAKGANTESEKIPEGNSSVANKDRQAKDSAGIRESAKKLPKFQFEESDYNFGSVNEGEMVDHNFSFTNTGNAPLIIKRASASCGCTVPSFPKDPVLPGQSSMIHVRFNSNNKENQQVKTITIEANTDPAVTRLQIHGFVIPKNQDNSSQ